MCPAGKWQAPSSVLRQQSCRVCESGTLQPEPGSISCWMCPPQGVDCGNRAAIDVHAGFFLPAAPSEMAGDGDVSGGGTSAAQTAAEGVSAAGANASFSVWRCPWEEACLGGQVAGNASCAAGHSGELCAHCMPGYCRGGHGCIKCAAGSGSTKDVLLNVLFASLVALMLLAATVRYLTLGDSKEEAPPPAERSSFCKRRCPVCAEAIGAMSTRGKIVRMFLGYFQCMSVFQTFQHVRWPTPFDRFLEWANAGSFQPLGDVLGMMPVECATGAHVDYFYYVALVLARPVLITLSLLLIARTSSICMSARTGPSGRHVSSVLLSPRLWDLLIWMVRTEKRHAPCMASAPRRISPSHFRPCDLDVSPARTCPPSRRLLSP